MSYVLGSGVLKQLLGNSTPNCCAACPRWFCRSTWTAGCARKASSELARDSGYSKHPTADRAALAVWFQCAANQGPLPKCLEGFPHTIAVLQTEEVPDPPGDLPQQAPQARTSRRDIR